MARQRTGTSIGTALMLITVVLDSSVPSVTSPHASTSYPVKHGLLVSSLYTWLAPFPPIYTRLSGDQIFCAGLRVSEITLPCISLYRQTAEYRNAPNRTWKSQNSNFESMDEQDIISWGECQGSQEYCDGDQFRASCYRPDEVVTITHAHYGLMSHGSCFDVQYHQVGCYADVTSHVAGVCSGRRSCEFTVNSDQLSADNCQRAYPFFLNASYSCVRVEHSRCSMCDSSGTAPVSSTERGLIASLISAEMQDENGCGTQRCPWIVEVPPGRVINLTLLDYGPTSDDTDSRPGLPPSLAYPSSESQCTGRRYAVVKERANPREVLVCGAGSNAPRRRHIYTSISNQLEIRVTGRGVLNWEAQFIIQYEAAGCADVTPPRHTWMRRTGDVVEVGCPTTGKRWNLTCVGGQWQGEIGKKCPGVPGVVIPGDPTEAETSNNDSQDFLSSFPTNVLIAAGLALACIIGVLIFTIGIVCIKRSQFKKRNQPSRPSSIYARATGEFEFRGELPRGGAGGPPETAPMIAESVRQRPPTAAKPRLSTGRQYPDGFVMYDADQQAVFARPMIGSRPLPSIPNGSTDRRRGPPVPHQTTVQMHPGAGQSMHSACTCHTQPRPAPQLAAKVRSIGTGPTADDGWSNTVTPIYGNTELPYSSPDDQHHYFVLDPDVVDDRPPPSPEPPPTTLRDAPTYGLVSAVDSDVGLRFPTPPPPLLEATLPPGSSGVNTVGGSTVGGGKATVSTRRQSPDGKEREEARDNSVDDELNKNHRSIHEIPLRPTRDGQAAPSNAIVAGGALCDDSGVDMGTSSWP